MWIDNVYIITHSLLYHKAAFTYSCSYTSDSHGLTGCHMINTHYQHTSKDTTPGVIFGVQLLTLMSGCRGP